MVRRPYPEFCGKNTGPHAVTGATAGPRASPACNAYRPVVGFDRVALLVRLEACGPTVTACGPALRRVAL